MSTSSTSPARRRSHSSGSNYCTTSTAAPKAPPHLRLTVVHDNKDFLVKTSQLLVDEADVLHMAFKIHFVVARLETLDLPPALCSPTEIR
jgi:hypothetical protein